MRTLWYIALVLVAVLAVTAIAVSAEKKESAPAISYEGASCPADGQDLTMGRKCTAGDGSVGTQCGNNCCNSTYYCCKCRKPDSPQTVCIPIIGEDCASYCNK